MKPVQGSKVKVEYTGTFDNGEVFDSSEGKGPLEFTLGEQQVIKGFESAVETMELDEEKSIIIPPQEAYGETNDQLIQKMPRERLPKDMEPKEGMTLGLQDPSGRVFPIKIVAVDTDTVTMDANHPLAGKTLHFKIKLIAIE